MNRREFERAVKAGQPATFTLRDTDEAKAMVGAKIIDMASEYATQALAAEAFGVSAATMNYLINERWDRYSFGHLLGMLVKAGVKIQITVA